MAATVQGRPRRIGLLAHGFASWGGGIDFLRIVASSLRHADPSAELHILAPMHGPLVRIRDARNWLRAQLGLGSVAAHRPGLADLERSFAGSDAKLHLIDIGPRALARCTAQLGLDVLIPAIAPQPPNGVPWVGYVFDFQHKHLPQFFTEHEREKRDREFGRLLNSASVVVVNSRSVVKDIHQYYPGCQAQIFAMPFSPAAAGDAFTGDIEAACQRHGLSAPYFIVCNQFWKHKDHGTAFKAFAKVAQRHPELSLVCTGATSDHRFPDHFAELMQQAERDGVAGRIRALGLIPKRDQFALLRGAVTLIQPTLFEGGPGGGAVFDAVAVGQRSIISDIPVNTEIDDPLVSFFAAGDVDSLAQRMEEALTAGPLPASGRDQMALFARGEARRKACGELLFEAMQCAMAPRPT